METHPAFSTWFCSEVSSVWHLHLRYNYSWILVTKVKPFPRYNSTNYIPSWKMGYGLFRHSTPEIRQFFEPFWTLATCPCRCWTSLDNGLPVFSFGVSWQETDKISSIDLRETNSPELSRSIGREDTSDWETFHLPSKFFVFTVGPIVFLVAMINRLLTSIGENFS